MSCAVVIEIPVTGVLTITPGRGGSAGIKQPGRKTTQWDQC